MKKRTYQEVISEINRLWKNEGQDVYQDDGFSQSVKSAMRKVAEEKFIGSDEKNRFYGEVYHIVKNEWSV